MFASVGMLQCKDRQHTDATGRHGPLRQSSAISRRRDSTYISLELQEIRYFWFFILLVHVKIFIHK